MVAGEKIFLVSKLPLSIGIRCKRVGEAMEVEVTMNITGINLHIGCPYLQYQRRY
jgi:hypothetical protein